MRQLLMVVSSSTHSFMPVYLSLCIGDYIGRINGHRVSVSGDEFLETVVAVVQQCKLI
jgi:hypothetical protein